jgi:hypothetical protein
VAEEQDRGAAQVHWLIAGRFGLGERGTTLTVTRADFNEILEKRRLEVAATIPDRIGQGETRTVKLAVSSLKDLSLKHVLSAVPELGALLAKAEQASKLKDPSIADLEALVGPGRLLESLRALLEPPKPAPTESAAAPATGSTDAIFEKAAVAQKSAKSAIDMFVRSASPARPTAKPAARQLRDAIEQAAYIAAGDVLRSAELEPIEVGWRGVRFLVGECPKEASMRVELLETDPAHVLEDLSARERGEEIDEPDCIFVAHDFDSVEPLAALADFAEQELMPVVVGVSPALFAASHPQELPSAFEALERARTGEVPEWAARWDELRMRESTRWLCAVANRVALHVEGAGEAKRAVFGTGVFGLAAMIAASYRSTGGFARIFGKNGSLRAPASHTIEQGAYKDTAAPTEAFYAISPSEALAKNGLLGLGSSRNSDQLALVKAPMVRGAADAVPLSAQVLTGRVVRFASWMKPQLPEGCDSKTANELFMTAANVFLFPGQEQAAHVRASTTNIDGEAHVVVRAAANPAIASIPFEIAFPLPLGWSVPAPEASATAPEASATAPEAGGSATTKSAKAEGTAAVDFGAEGAPETHGGAGLRGGSVGFDVGIDRKDD